MARTILRKKGNVTELQKVHSLSNPLTWLLMVMWPYWILHPSHTFRLL